MSTQKQRCRDLEPLFTCYVDEEAAPADRASVEAHLQACPPCRERVAGERAARGVLRARRADLRGCASAELRTRCAAQRAAASARRGLFSRRALLPLSMAATLVLAIAGVLLFGLGSEVEALAAQLTVDHMKCFQFGPTSAGLDANIAGREWEAKYGWPLKVPPPATAERLELIGARRCLSSKGGVAHLLYRWRGQPLSVYVLNKPVASIAGREQGGSMFQSAEKLGEQTIVWSKGRRTYAVVARAPALDLMHVAHYVRQSAE